MNGGSVKIGQISITVAALTRRRPKMLERLLDSLAALETVPSASVDVLIVENDDAPRNRDLVEARAAGFPVPLRYVHEPELGIPFARNRAAREAIAAGHDLLAFVDDDEMVAPDWLARLVAGWRSGPAMLVGAPLLIADAPQDLTFTQRLMHDNIRRRYRSKAAAAARVGSPADSGPTTTVTNNWLAELALFTEHGLWFDEAMRFTGGTDAKFHDQARARGLPVGWVADARVFETIPPERLTFGYQFRRARDQSTSNFRRKGPPTSRRLIRDGAAVAARVVSVVVLVLALPLTGGRTLLTVARSSGWIIGRLRAWRGGTSDLYANVTGN